MILPEGIASSPAAAVSAAVLCYLTTPLWPLYHSCLFTMASRRPPLYQSYC